MFHTFWRLKQMPNRHGRNSVLKLLLSVWLVATTTFFLPLQAAPGWRTTPLVVPGTGKTGFTQIPASQAGITFSNWISDEQISRNRLVEDGSGVAAGDIDGDGLCDLYFCSLERGNSLFRNVGNWRFENVTPGSPEVACLGQFSTGATFADVDGDGDLDLLVAGLGKGVRLFLNDGKGHFHESTNSGLLQHFGARSMALADIDGDGDLDLYVANYRTTTVRDSPIAVKVKQVAGKWEVPPEHRERFVAEAGPKNAIALLELGEPDILYRNDGHGHFQPLSWTDGRFLDENGKPLTIPPRDWGLSAMFHDITAMAWSICMFVMIISLRTGFGLTRAKVFFVLSHPCHCGRLATQQWLSILPMLIGMATMTFL